MPSKKSKFVEMLKSLHENPQAFKVELIGDGQSSPKRTQHPALTLFAIERPYTFISVFDGKPK